MSIDSYQRYVNLTLFERENYWNATGTENKTYFDLERGANPLPNSCCRIESDYCGISNNFTGRPVELKVKSYDDPKVFSKFIADIQKWMSGQNNDITNSTAYPSFSFVTRPTREITLNKLSTDHVSAFLQGRDLNEPKQPEVDYDYFEDYDYETDMTNAHNIWGVGCGAKLNEKKERE